MFAYNRLAFVKERRLRLLTPLEVGAPCRDALSLESLKKADDRSGILRRSMAFDISPANGIAPKKIHTTTLFRPSTKKAHIMAVERTLSIIKPDATARNITGKIIAKFEEAGLRVIAQKRVRWDETDAASFYAVHKERPFYQDLIAFMTSGPIVVQILEGENAVAKNRDIMGATNPANAAPGTIRAEFAENIERNSVHGSDSVDNAAQEIMLCFEESEIVG